MIHLDYFSPKFTRARYALTLIFMMIISFNSVMGFIDGLSHGIPAEQIGQVNLSEKEIISNMLFNLLSMLVTVGIVLAIQPKLLETFFDLRIQWPAILLLLALSFLLANVDGLFPSLFEDPTVADYFTQERDHYPMLTILTLIFVGYSEELLYRMLPISFSDNHPVVLGVIWQLLFAAGHLYQGLGGFIGSFLFGLLFWFGIRKGVNLHSAALTHALYDILVTFY